MADKQAYLDLAVIGDLFAKGVSRDAKAIEMLAEILDSADTRFLTDWPVMVKAEWFDGLDRVLAVMNDSKLSESDIKLLSAMLKLKFEGLERRSRYAAMVKTVYSEFPNTDALVEALGCNDTKVNLSKVYARLSMVPYVKVGVFCYDLAYGLGEVVDVNLVNDEIAVQMGRRRLLRLRQYFDSLYVVRPESRLAQIIAGTFEGKFADAVEFGEEMKSSVVCVQPFSVAVIKRMLVPAKLTDADFTAISNGRERGASGKSSKIAEDKVLANTENSRWDGSRGVDELVGRLKDLDSLELENPNFDNIRNIFESSAIRFDQAEKFATAVALLYKGKIYNDVLSKMLIDIADRAVCWSNSAIFIEISDKLPGKIVRPWFQASRDIKGSAWLVEHTLKMPYRLWDHTEKLLEDNPAEKTMLADRVFECFKEGKVNAEMFFWLWKAPKSELRDKYMSNSYLLFKTLHVEVKGSYLKSQRLLHHMLVDDDAFQKTVMRGGDTEAIRALTHCVKHLPLLDAGERQSLLVKIVRHYPEAIKIVEERRNAPIKRSIGKITSVRSYAMAKLELQDLIDVQIPENITAIEHARSLGDLRENSEFKYAKERQRLLGIRRSELETILAETRTVDFSEVKLEGTVIPGCVVTLKYSNGNPDDVFTLLGRLDSDPDKQIISYETPLGKVLMGVKVGDEVDMPSGDVAKVASITALPDELVAWLNSAPNA